MDQIKSQASRPAREHPEEDLKAILRKPSQLILGKISLMQYDVRLVQLRNHQLRVRNRRIGIQGSKQRCLIRTRWFPTSMNGRHWMDPTNKLSSCLRVLRNEMFLRSLPRSATSRPNRKYGLTPTDHLWPDIFQCGVWPRSQLVFC